MGNRDRGQPVLPIILQQDAHDVRIPLWVHDHASFRRWATSDDFPERGQYAYLNGELWVDISMERFAHNQIKSAVSITLGHLVANGQMGHFLCDRMMLTNKSAGLSTEPDAMFFSHEAVKSGRVELRQGDESLEVLGTPDMVLEVVSPSSKQKDKVVLRELYWLAGIREYWLSETTGDEVSLDILRHSPKGYVSVRKQAGRVKSSVFGKSFRLMCQSGPSDLAVCSLLAS